MTRNNPTIIAFVLQGRARVITDDEGDPHQFNGIGEANEWLEENSVRHMGLSAADSIVVLDVATGETDEFF